jgi:NAD(P)-dependent dehydrogenase (short-subunit alcohol dehydrogenase family)
LKHKNLEAGLGDALVLVTGAAAGIGAATCLAFADRGARIFAVDIDEAGAKATAEACLEAGAPVAEAVACDVADAAAMAELAEWVAAEHGPLDVLVNNAGVGLTGELLGMTRADWEWVRGVNLDGVINGLMAFGPGMVERGRGHVVNVASGLGYAIRATEPGYVTTKAGVIALSQCVRADWGRRGVGVSVVCPGVIDTPIIEHTRFVGSRDDTAVKDKTAKLFHHGHPPAKVARAIVAAVEHDRGFVTVGWEARAGWILHRLVPTALQQRFGTALTEPIAPSGA